MYYIQESDKPCKLLKLFNYIRVRDNNIILPIQKENISEKQSEKLANNTNKIIKALNDKGIIVSKELKKQVQYLNYLYSYGLEIVDGKWLFQMLSYMILEYIVKKENLQKEKLFISILVNQANESIIYFLKKVVKEYKRINIVTNNITIFKNFETQIMEQYGVMITVTNNKRKSLSKSQIIFNFDFPTELLQRYDIYENAIVVNLQNDIKIKNKRFNGICINDYEIETSIFERVDFNKFCIKDIYEGLMYKKQPVGEIMKKIKTDGVAIKKLYTSRNMEF